MKHTFALIALCLAANAGASEITAQVTWTVENADGAYVATGSVSKGSAQETIAYELVAGSEDVSKTISDCGKRDARLLTANGSVLSRSYEIDHENHRDGMETVKFFVRSATCGAPRAR
jgi:hypothetical protein